MNVRLNSRDLNNNLLKINLNARTHLRGGVPSGHRRWVCHVTDGRRHGGHRWAGRRHRRCVTARHAVLGRNGGGGGEGCGNGRRCLLVCGRRGARWRGRGRHTADDHGRRRHGLVVGRLMSAAAVSVARRSVRRRGLAEHDRLRVSPLVARPVLLSERTSVVPGPAATTIAIRMTDAKYKKKKPLIDCVNLLEEWGNFNRWGDGYVCSFETIHFSKFMNINSLNIVLKSVQVLCKRIGGEGICRMLKISDKGVGRGG